MEKTRIEGTIICRSRDEFGEIVIADNLNIRSLYFGNSVMQSSIRLDKPAELVMDFHQAMMSCLLFQRRPGTALIIGLGGGSLVNFLHAACPYCAMDVIEIRREVIRVTNEYFLLPENSSRIRITHAAGQDFVRSHSGTGGLYDLILVDAFDEGGPASALLGEEFLVSCQSLLTERGIFAINLWNRPSDNFPAMLQTVREAFEGNVLKLLLGEAYTNALVFGFGDGSIFRDLSFYRPFARQLKEEFSINFPRFLKNIYWQNFC